ncbi:MAG: NADH:ubiquinone oxidoreductase subunit 6 (chain J) [Thermoplasmatales archaeon]|nr:NADH:ubiquinone oxidoreductase subunit 6 (chain J) [Thermoplasmatales archaeon]
MIDDIVDSIVGAVTGAYEYVLANMDVVAFVILAAIALTAAVFVVASKEIMHSAFYLALVFVCVATTYYFLEAEFLGVVQILVYVGAITILFAFSIMLTRRTIMDEEECP